MSVRVIDQVLEHSRAKGTTRNVLAMLADAAHHDGVTWAHQGPVDDPRSIAARANASLRSVERAIHTLVQLGELEVRKARRGRSYVNVYRVTVGSITEQDVDYTRLPFDLDTPFTTTRQHGGLNEAVHTATSGGLNDDSTRHPVAFNPPELTVQPAKTAALRARVSSDPSLTRPATSAPELDTSDAAAANKLRRHGWTPTQLDTAAAKPGGLQLAVQLLDECAADPTCRRPAGLAWRKLQAGQKPLEPQPAVAVGATGTRSTSRRGDWPCPHPSCGLWFPTQTAADEHHRVVHAHLDAAPPPPDLVARLTGRSAA